MQFLYYLLSFMYINLCYLFAILIHYAVIFAATPTMLFFKPKNEQDKHPAFLIFPIPLSCSPFDTMSELVDRSGMWHGFILLALDAAYW